MEATLLWHLGGFYDIFFVKFTKLMVWDIPWRLLSLARTKLMDCVVKELQALLMIISCWNASVCHNCRTGNHLISYWPVLKVCFIIIVSVLCFSEKCQYNCICIGCQCKIIRMRNFSSTCPCMYIIPNEEMRFYSLWCVCKWSNKFMV